MSVNDDIIQPTSDSFWEVDCYKRTVKRQEDGHKLCTDLMQLIQDRADIEKHYAKSLRGWSKKWNEFIEKGPEYGTTEAAWKGVLQEAERVAELHLTVKEQLINNVQNQIKQWRADNYHKSMVGQCKETKELEDMFKKAQKPWRKLMRAVLSSRREYHSSCRALYTVEEGAPGAGGGGSTPRGSPQAQKPWAKRLARVIKARKDYHSATKLEKTATHQESNARSDSAVSPDQMKKLQEKAEKCRRDVESTREKYEAALNDINSYNAKYMEDMTEVFNKSQAFEERRLKFFKEMLFGIHKCLDLSGNPEYGQIYQQLHQTIEVADYMKDLKWWSNCHGVDMAMNWPTFEDYQPEFSQISKKKKKDGMESSVTLRGISTNRFHEEFAEYSPEPHTISRKEKKVNPDGITLTSMSFKNEPPASTHVPVQQSYSNYSSDEQQPPQPQSAAYQTQNSQNSNGSALEDWAEGDQDHMEEVMRVPIRAVYDYNGQEDDELSFKSGDVFVKLKNEDDQGWCVGEKDGRVGLYPKDYVEGI